MPGISARHKQLDEELFALGEDTMMLEELDGFIAGLLVCPDLVTPNEWLPVIWDEREDRQSPFETVDHANRVFALIMDHYNDVVATLTERPDEYWPLFSVRDDEVVWQIWMEGFATAVSLRPNAWEKLLDGSEETSEAMMGLLALVEIVYENKDLPRGFVEELSERAVDLIPEWIVTLNNHRLAHHKGPPAVVVHAPGGNPIWVPVDSAEGERGNDPCPCGSGKKYRQCCGLN
jgi:uncharacterized protein